MKTKIFPLFITLAFAVCTKAQNNDSIAVLHAIVGDTIDKVEREKYSLFGFANPSTFSYAVFYILSDTSAYKLKVVYTGGQVSERKITAKQFAEMKEQINSKYKVANSANMEMKYYVFCYDGKIILGTVKQNEEDYLMVQTKNHGMIKVDKVNIKSLELADEVQVGKKSDITQIYNETNYFIGPSALNLKKGSGYYQNVDILLNFFNVGITDNFSIGGGGDLRNAIFGFSQPSFSQPSFMLTAKGGWQLQNNLHAAFGATFINIKSNGYREVDKVDKESVLGYGLLTYGNKFNNLTIGCGFNYIRHTFVLKKYVGTLHPVLTDSISEVYAPYPLISFSGMIRLSRTVSFLTENYFEMAKTYQIDYGYYYSPQALYLRSFDYKTYLSVGLRIAGNYVSSSFGLFYREDNGYGYRSILPYIDFVIKFGGKKKK